MTRPCRALGLLDVASVVVLTRLGAPRGMTSVVRLRVMTRPCRAFGLLDVAGVVVLTRLGDRKSVV